MCADILIVDDEADIRNLIQGILEDEGFKCRGAANSTQTFEQIDAQKPDLVVLDIWLQGSEMDGLEILSEIKHRHPLMPVVMISGHGTIETAVSAIKDGAYDFIEKPFKSDRLILMIKRALETATLRQENQDLRQKVNVNHTMIGNSQALQALKQVLERVAPTNSRVLLTGEAGVGKDVAARAIHASSKRADKPFLVLNCATMRPERLEIELFGTQGENGPNSGHLGILEKANGGTLLLDEVADMPLETQGKIVRVLQNQSFQKIGSSTETEVDVRILACTNKDLEDEIESGAFRQDLYYRLNVVPIHIPSLKERPQDIPALVQSFCAYISKNSGLAVAEFSEGALAVLQSYAWPGNIRQLRNTVEWVLIMHGYNDGEAYESKHLPPDINTAAIAENSIHTNDLNSDDFIGLSLREARESFEKSYLSAQIHRFGGNISKTAKFIGMERSALHRKLKSLDIQYGEKEEGEDSVFVEQKRKRA